MKFAYVDESGDEGQGDTFVMIGVLIDAYRLRKYTVKFDKMIVDFLAKHPGAPKELKTKAFINGAGGWSQVDANERKRFLGEVCGLVAECAKIFGIGFSLAAYKKAADSGPPFAKSYWLGAAMFIAALRAGALIRLPSATGVWSASASTTPASFNLSATAT